MSGAGHRTNGPASPTGKYIDGIDPDDPAYIKNLQRPAEVKEDLQQMENRSRVSLILNSQAFKEELEQVVEEQLRNGPYPASLIALQQITDLLLPHSKGSLGSLARSSSVIPINDMRGTESFGFVKGEKLLRCKLAALYRLVNLCGWSHGIHNHISARVSTESEHFLLNPFGLTYSEITASSLIKVDIRGDIVEPGSSHLGVFKAGFSVHSAIHQARPDIKCIVHLHTPAAVAISALKCGLLAMSQEALICGNISYHDFQGIAVDADEREKLARSLGVHNKILILRNRGVLACGETVEEAFHFTFNVMAACEAQVKAMPVGLDNIVIPSAEAREQTFRVANQGGGGVDGTGRKWKTGELEFEALMRTLDNSGFRTGHVYKMPVIKQEKKERSNSEVEIPPSSSSFTYIFDGDYEHSKYASPVKAAMERQKKAYKAGWLTTPNAYKKTEVEEIGTTTPKRITKWVTEEDSPNRPAGTPFKVDSPNQFAPQGDNPKEYREKQKSIKKDYYEERINAGPQSKILEGLTWDEAQKVKDGQLSATGDQQIVVGAASKGIIQRGHQHNAIVYRQYYAANPFENMSEAEIDEYQAEVQRRERGDPVPIVEEEIPEPVVEVVKESPAPQRPPEPVRQDTEARRSRPQEEARDVPDNSRYQPSPGHDTINEEAMLASLADRVVQTVIHDALSVARQGKGQQISLGAEPLHKHHFLIQGPVGSQINPDRSDFADFCRGTRSLKVNYSKHFHADKCSDFHHHNSDRTHTQKCKKKHYRISGNYETVAETYHCKTGVSSSKDDPFCQKYKQLDHRRSEVATTISICDVQVKKKKRTTNELSSGDSIEDILTIIPDQCCQYSETEYSNSEHPEVGCSNSEHPEVGCSNSEHPEVGCSNSEHPEVGCSYSEHPEVGCSNSELPAVLSGQSVHKRFNESCLTRAAETTEDTMLVNEVPIQLVKSSHEFVKTTDEFVKTTDEFVKTTDEFVKTDELDRKPFLLNSIESRHENIKRLVELGLALHAKSDNVTDNPGYPKQENCISQQIFSDICNLISYADAITSIGPPEIIAYPVTRDPVQGTRGTSGESDGRRQRFERRSQSARSSRTAESRKVTNQDISGSESPASRQKWVPKHKQENRRNVEQGQETASHEGSDRDETYEEFVTSVEKNYGRQTRRQIEGERDALKNEDSLWKEREEKKTRRSEEARTSRDERQRSRDLSSNRRGDDRRQDRDYGDRRRDRYVSSRRDHEFIDYYSDDDRNEPYSRNHRNYRSERARRDDRSSRETHNRRDLRREKGNKERETKYTDSDNRTETDSDQSSGTRHSARRGQTHNKSEDRLIRELKGKIEDRKSRMFENNQDIEKEILFGKLIREAEGQKPIRAAEGTQSNLEAEGQKVILEVEKQKVYQEVGAARKQMEKLAAKVDLSVHETNSDTEPIKGKELPDENLKEVMKTVDSFVKDDSSDAWENEGLGFENRRGDYRDRKSSSRRYRGKSEDRHRRKGYEENRRNSDDESRTGKRDDTLDRSVDYNKENLGSDAQRRNRRTHRSKHEREDGQDVLTERNMYSVNDSSQRKHHRNKEKERSSRKPVEHISGLPASSHSTHIPFESTKTREDIRVFDKSSSSTRVEAAPPEDVARLSPEHERTFTHPDGEFNESLSKVKSDVKVGRGGDYDKRRKKEHIKSQREHSYDKEKEYKGKHITDDSYSAPHAESAHVRRTDIDNMDVTGDSRDLSYSAPVPEKILPHTRSPVKESVEHRRSKDRDTSNRQDPSPPRFLQSQVFDVNSSLIDIHNSHENNRNNIDKFEKQADDHVNEKIERKAGASIFKEVVDSLFPSTTSEQSNRNIEADNTRHKHDIREVARGKEKHKRHERMGLEMEQRDKTTLEREHKSARRNKGGRVAPKAVPEDDIIIGCKETGHGSSRSANVYKDRRGRSAGDRHIADDDRQSQVEKEEKGRNRSAAYKENRYRSAGDKDRHIDETLQLKDLKSERSKKGGSGFTEELDTDEVDNVIDIKATKLECQFLKSQLPKQNVREVEDTPYPSKREGFDLRSETLKSSNSMSFTETPIAITPVERNEDRYQVTTSGRAVTYLHKATDFLDEEEKDVTEAKRLKDARITSKGSAGIIVKARRESDRWYPVRSEKNVSDKDINDDQTVLQGRDKSIARSSNVSTQSAEKTRREAEIPPLKGNERLIGADFSDGEKRRHDIGGRVSAPSIVSESVLEATRQTRRPYPVRGNERGSPVADLSLEEQIIPNKDINMASNVLSQVVPKIASEASRAYHEKKNERGTLETDFSIADKERSFTSKVVSDVVPKIASEASRDGKKNERGTLETDFSIEDKERSFTSKVVSEVVPKIASEASRAYHGKKNERGSLETDFSDEDKRSFTSKVVSEVVPKIASEASRAYHGKKNERGSLETDFSDEGKKRSFTSKVVSEVPKIASQASIAYHGKKNERGTLETDFSIEDKERSFTSKVVSEVVPKIASGASRSYHGKKNERGSLEADFSDEKKRSFTSKVVSEVVPKIASEASRSYVIKNERNIHETDFSIEDKKISGNRTFESKVVSEVSKAASEARRSYNVKRNERSTPETDFSRGKVISSDRTFESKVVSEVVPKLASEIRRPYPESRNKRSGQDEDYPDEDQKQDKYSAAKIGSEVVTKRTWRSVPEVVVPRQDTRIDERTDPRFYDPNVTPVRHSGASLYEDYSVPEAAVKVQERQKYAGFVKRTGRGGRKSHPMRGVSLEDEESGERPGENVENTRTIESKSDMRRNQNETKLDTSFNDDFSAVVHDNPIELTIDQDEDQPPHSPPKKSIFNLFSCVGGRSAHAARMMGSSKKKRPTAYYEEDEKRKIKKISKSKEKEEKKMLYFEKPEEASDSNHGGEESFTGQQQQHEESSDEDASQMPNVKPQLPYMTRRDMLLKRPPPFHPPKLTFDESYDTFDDTFDDISTEDDETSHKINEEKVLPEVSNTADVSDHEGEGKFSTFMSFGKSNISPSMARPGRFAFGKSPETESGTVRTNSATDDWENGAEIGRERLFNETEKISAVKSTHSVEEVELRNDRPSSFSMDVTMRPKSSRISETRDSGITTTRSSMRKEVTSVGRMSGARLSDFIANVPPPSFGEAEGATATETSFPPPPDKLDSSSSSML